MSKRSILLVSAICLLGGAEAFSPSSHHAGLRSSLFSPRTIRTAPRFAEQESSSEKKKNAETGAVGIKKAPSVSLLQRIDNAGMSLKPKAMEAKEKLANLRKPSKKFRYTLQSCALFSLFIVYRAYRGFFVILPAVFKEVYQTMEKTVESPFAEIEPVVDKDDVNPKTGKLRLRTVATVSILAGIVTLSYTLTGALRVLGSFVRSMTKTSSPSTSFLAAADEMETNESKIMSLTKRKRVNGEALDGMVP